MRLQVAWIGYPEVIRMALHLLTFICVRVDSTSPTWPLICRNPWLSSASTPPYVDHMVSNVTAWIWNDQFDIIYKEINQPAEDSISRTLAESHEVVEILRDMTDSDRSASREGGGWEWG